MIPDLSRELADAQAEIRDLRHKLAHANGNAALLEMARALVVEQLELIDVLQAQLADERAQAIGQAPSALQDALVAWRETYPDWDGPTFNHHHLHRRGVFTDVCPACVAEKTLLLLADKMDRTTVQPSAGTNPASERASQAAQPETAVHGRSVASSITS